MADDPFDPEILEKLTWTGGRRVRWSRSGDVFLLRLSEVTSQGRVYKQTLDYFFRHEFRDWRPRYGDFAVEIRLFVQPGLPKLDLDNLAKALLDGIKGALFYDDAQVGRLVVERFEGPVEHVLVAVYPRTP